jgi:hypothetical protein
MRDTSRMRWRGLCAAVILVAGAGANTTASAGASAGANATAGAGAAASVRPAVWTLDLAALAAAGCSDAVAASVALCEACAVNNIWPVAGRGPDEEWCLMVHASDPCWLPCFCAANASNASIFGLAWVQARLAATRAVRADRVVRDAGGAVGGAAARPRPGGVPRAQLRSNVLRSDVLRSDVRVVD